MLNKVKQYAAEIYPGDEALAEQFVEGFIKEADVSTRRDYDSDNEFSGKSVTTSKVDLSGMLTGGFGQAIGKGLGGMAVGLGIHGLNSAMSSIAQGNLHTEFLTALARAISSNRILREADKERVEQYAATIFKFAPHVACDSNLLSSILANSIHGEGIDPMTIKTLGDLESRFIENRSAGSFSPKTYV